MTEFLVSALFWQKTLETPVEVPPTNKYTREEVIQSPSPRKKSTYAYHQSRRKQSRSLRSTYKKSPHTAYRIPHTTLIFAPHPDDEILCCSLTMREKLEAGERVKIVYMTDGDALHKNNSKKIRAYALKRRDESITATSSLGLKRHDLTFLGFPDGHLDELGAQPIVSDYSDRSRTAPGTFHPGSTYARQEAIRQIQQIIMRTKPDEIYIPSSHMDHHADHQETNHLVREALAKTSQRPNIQTYIIHNLPRWLSTKAPKNPWKLRLIRHFRSQFHDDWHQTFLEKFAAIPERFYPVEEEVAKE